MIKNIKLYKSTSLEIIALLKRNELNQLDKLLDRRQEILDKEIKNKSFKEVLVKEGILDIDKQIKDLLSQSIDEIKEEINLHKRSNVANNSYINFHKDNLNIFNKKV